MKELEKTKRISIASVITILVVLIAIISYKRPKHNYAYNTEQTLTQLRNESVFISNKDLNDTDYAIIDIRNQFDFERGHLPNAIGLSSEVLLEDGNTAILEQFKKDGKIVSLYGNHPEQALMPYMLLRQLGYDKINIIAINLNYENNKLIVSDYKTQNKDLDIPAFIAKKKKEAALKSKPIPVKVVPKKKIIPKKKKKKMPIEGGC